MTEVKRPEFRAWGTSSPYTNESEWHWCNSQSHLNKGLISLIRHIVLPPLGEGIHTVVVFLPESFEGRIFGLQSKEDSSNKRVFHVSEQLAAGHSRSLVIGFIKNGLQVCKYKGNFKSDFQCVTLCIYLCRN